MRVKAIIELKANVEHRTTDRLIGYVVLGPMNEAEVAETISEPMSNAGTLVLTDVSGHHRGSIVHVNVAEVRTIELIIEQNG